MAKATLLEIVQEILSDMTSDEVNSIGETVESSQVATIVKRTYFNIVNDRLWPSTKALIKLVPYSDPALPTHMKLSDATIEIDWVKYNMADAGDPPEYRTVLWKSPSDFVNLLLARDAGASNVQTVLEPSGVPLFVFNDQQPTYYTTFDDETLVFDSYDNAADSTLQASKIHVYGAVEPTWVHEDDFVPDMPAKYFPYLINEAKSTAFLKIKEVFSQKDEQNSQRQKSWLAQHKYRATRENRRPDYGRKAPGRGRYSRAGYRNNHFTG